MNRIANVASPATVFYSYAHEDEALRDELNKHLSLLKQQGRITDWYDREIIPGTDWAHAIDKHLMSASVILLLVSPDFLASEYCYGIEMQRALERHAAGTAYVIPIILRPVDWYNAPFSNLQCLPRNKEPVTTWNNQDNAFLDITQGIRAAVEYLQSSKGDSLSSYEPKNTLLPHFGRSTNSFLSSTPHHRWSFWLVPMFIAIGVIISIIFFIQQSWFAAAVAFLVTLIIAFISTIIVKVWQRSGELWIEQIVGQLSIYVEGFFSRYQKQYYEYLRYQHQHFDVKGLSTQNTFTLEMDQVFVDLAIVPTSTVQVTANPLQIRKRLHEEEWSIWEYLSSPSLINQHFVVIGPPGSGKTTLMKHLTLALVTRKNLYHQYKLPYKTPFLLFLRDHAHSIHEKPDLSLIDAIQDHLMKRWKQTLPPNWIHQRLARGKSLILLDGLDEVADVSIRRAVVDWVQQQMIMYGKNKFIITSRPFGYLNNPLESITLLEIRPFTNAKIEQFIRKWYFANELMSARREDPGVIMRADEGAEDLLRRMGRKPELFELAVNPLLLTMMTTVHRYRGSLPGKRITLYSEICEVFLGKRQEARGLIQEFSPVQKQQVLQSLAFHMMSQQMREISFIEAQQTISDVLKNVSPNTSPKAFLQHIENSSGLLLEKEYGVYIFAHLTFQEYLASIYIKEYNLEQMLVAQVENSWWRETILLYCAQADASAIISASIAGESLSLYLLRLALDSLQEALKVQPTVRAELGDLINQRVQDQDPNWRHLIAKTLLAQRIRQMVHLDGEKYIDTSPVSNAEYQLFIDKYQEEERYLQPDHWVSTAFVKGQGLVPTLGVRSTDAIAFCDWLTHGQDLTNVYDEVGIWQYRLPTKDEFELAMKNGNINLSQMKKIDCWVDEGKRLAGISPTLSFSPAMIQSTFDPLKIRILIPLMLRMLTLPRIVIKSYSIDQTQEIIDNLSPILGFARLLARTYTLPRYAIDDNLTYYSLSSGENNMQPLPNLERAIKSLVEGAFIHNTPLESVTMHIYKYANECNVKFMPEKYYVISSSLLNKSLRSVSNNIQAGARDLISGIEEEIIFIDRISLASENGPFDRYKSLKEHFSTKNTMRIINRIQALEYQKDELSHILNVDLPKHLDFIRSHIDTLLDHNIPDYLNSINYDDIFPKSINAIKYSASMLSGDYRSINDFIRSFTSTSTPTFKSIRKHIIFLNHALKLADDRTFNTIYIPKDILPSGDITIFLHTSICFLALLLTEDLFSLKNKISTLMKRKDEDLENLISQCINIYIKSSIIRERIQRNIPPYEGILLVKEPN